MKPTPMKSTEFRRLLADLGLTQEQAATMLGVSLRSTNGWANGKPIPLAVGELMRHYRDAGAPPWV